MSLPRFIQISTLSTFPASLLNRDDSGLAKRIPFGGAVRTRVSSQCLKRHWRLADDDYSLSQVEQGLDLSVRSRYTFPELIERPLVSQGLGQALVVAASQALQKKLYSNVPTVGEDGFSEGRSEIVVLGQPEVKFLQDAIRSVVKEASNEKDAAKKAEDFYKNQRDNFLAIKAGCGIDAALFGRFVSGDVDAKVTAAVHVAHGFTVHGEQSETDYFVAIDDIPQAGKGAGASHINAAELTTGLYYCYVVVDVPQLVSNLCGCEATQWLSADKELPSRVVKHLIHLMSTVTPGAKLSATAPYGSTWFVLAEAGSSQPRSLADAFYEPVASNASKGHVIAMLSDYLQRYDNMYEPKLKRWFASMEPQCSVPGAVPSTLAELSQAVAEAIQTAREV